MIQHKSVSKSLCRRGEEIHALAEDAASTGNTKPLEIALSSFKHPKNVPDLVKPESTVSIILYIALYASVLLSICWLFIFSFAFFTALNSFEFHDFTCIFLFLSCLFIVVNAAVAAYASNEIRFQKQYQKYYIVMQHRTYESMELLSAFAEQPVAVVQRDLKTAMKKGAIAFGQFSDDHSLFLLSDAPDNKADPHVSCADLKQLPAEIGLLYAECIGKSGFHIPKESLDPDLLLECQNGFKQYCYEIKAHPNQSDTTLKILNSYIDSIDVILHGKNGSAEKSVFSTADRQMLHSVNELFIGLLFDLCRQL